MRGKLSLLLAIIMLFGILAGCQKDVDERTLSVFELKFSDEEVEALEVAYKKQKIERASFDISTDTLEMLWEQAKPRYPYEGGLIYYGTFDDCVVWRTGLGQGAHEEVDFELAGSRFYNPTSLTLYVCREETLMTLQEAYEQGFISAEDIAIVAARHAEYNEE